MRVKVGMIFNGLEPTFFLLSAVQVASPFRVRGRAEGLFLPQRGQKARHVEGAAVAQSQDAQVGHADRDPADGAHVTTCREYY